ncbi:MAG TPA: phosphoribosylglycinamide synthetase C domain-containing protein, partial [bacterium]
ILPLLDGDLGATIIDVLDGRAPHLKWRDEFAACVVLASGGYPGSHQTGLPIHGLEADPDDVMIFHAGTRRDGDALVTAGGRVLNVVGRGPTLQRAVSRAYAGVAHLSFEGMQFRTDLGRPSNRLSEVSV